MESLLFIGHEYIAANAMRLLMEQEIRWRYDVWTHIWFVLLAYGDGGQEIAQRIQVLKEYGSDELFDLKKLRDHRAYGFCVSRENGDAAEEVL